MQSYLLNVTSTGNEVTAYTCPVGKVAKVDLLNIGSSTNGSQVHHFYLNYKSIKVKDVNLLRSAPAAAYPEGSVPDCIRVQGSYSINNLAEIVAFVPKVHYLRGGDTVKIKGQSTGNQNMLNLLMSVLEEDA